MWSVKLLLQFHLTVAANHDNNGNHAHRNNRDRDPRDGTALHSLLFLREHVELYGMLRFYYSSQGFRGLEEVEDLYSENISFVVLRLTY